MSQNNSTILVTGGAGYIGSHTCVELLNAGYRVVVVDNLVNSSMEALNRVQLITGKTLEFHNIDVRDEQALRSVFSQSAIDAVIHFAGLKAVGESVAKPNEYYDNNVHGSLVLTRVMAEFDVFRIIFSSTATVYGEPETVPITEDFPLWATNPYSRSKLMIEDILRDLAISDERWNAISLRYFNPVGAHESGLIGEDPSGIPNNLMPFISQIAVGKLEKLSVYGNDYDTVDGTGVRDYIHVVDLSCGHLNALEALDSNKGFTGINLGTGRGQSVLEMITAFERASGKTIPYEIVGRRPGDVPVLCADSTMAAEVLGWSAERDLDKMMEDTWRWQSQYPDGFGV